MCATLRDISTFLSLPHQCFLFQPNWTSHLFPDLFRPLSSPAKCFFHNPEYAHLHLHLSKSQPSWRPNLKAHLRGQIFMKMKRLLLVKPGFPSPLCLTVLFTPPPRLLLYSVPYYSWSFLDTSWDRILVISARPTIPLPVPSTSLLKQKTPNWWWEHPSLKLYLCSSVLVLSMGRLSIGSDTRNIYLLWHRPSSAWSRCQLVRLNIRPLVPFWSLRWIQPLSTSQGDDDGQVRLCTWKYVVKWEVLRKCKSGLLSGFLGCVCRVGYSALSISFCFAQSRISGADWGVVGQLNRTQQLFEASPFNFQLWIFKFSVNKFWKT